MGIRSIEELSVGSELADAPELVVVENGTARADSHPGITEGSGGLAVAHEVEIDTLTFEEPYAHHRHNIIITQSVSGSAAGGIVASPMRAIASARLYY